MNGVNETPGGGVTPTNTFGFGALHVGVDPGGAAHYTGLVSDLTISDVPEPASLGLAGLAALTLLPRRGRA